MAFDPEKAKGNMAGRPSNKELDDLMQDPAYSAGKEVVRVAEQIIQDGRRYSDVGNGMPHEPNPAQLDFELKHVPKVTDPTEESPDA